MSNWDDTTEFIHNVSQDQGIAIEKWCDEGLEVKIDINELRILTKIKPNGLTLPDTVSFVREDSVVDAYIKLKHNGRRFMQIAIYKPTHNYEDQWKNYVRPILEYVWMKVYTDNS